MKTKRRNEADSRGVNPIGFVLFDSCNSSRARHHDSTGKPDEFAGIERGFCQSAVCRVRGNCRYVLMRGSGGTPIPDWLIFTVAGGGTGGDGGQTTGGGSLNWLPVGVVVDFKGNLYVAEVLGNRVRKVDTNGVITTVAGDGNNNFSPDGILAVNASLQQPQNIALDSSGNIYITDQGNGRIRKVGFRRPCLVTSDGQRHLEGSTAVSNGLATNASLSNPKCLAIDSLGNILIADSGNSRIRKVTTDGYITTVAGNGNATYGGDGGLAVNAGSA